MAGWSGVTLFFILSGFLLFRPYAKSLLYAHAWPSTRTFYLRRALRILPGYYISLALLIVLAHPEYMQPNHLQNLLLFVTLFMDSTKQTYQMINGPFWTLAVEWQFYLLLPWLALGLSWLVHLGSLSRRLWLLTLCLCGVILWGIGTNYLGCYALYDHPGTTFGLPQPLFNILTFFFYGMSGKYLEDFAVGMLISVLFTVSRSMSPERKLPRYLTLSRKAFLSVGVLLLIFMAAWSNYPALMFLNPYIGAHEAFTETGFALGFGLCIIALLSGPTLLKQVLEHHHVRWIGCISYSLYIWHLPILLYFMTHILPLTHHWNALFVYLLYWACAALIVFPFSALFYRIVEQPGMRLAERTRKDAVRTR